MKTRLVLASIATLVLVTASQLLAHHGTGISYDLQHNPMILKGTVTEFRWANPHVSIYIDVKDANGKVQNWANRMHEYRWVCPQRIQPQLIEARPRGHGSCLPIES